MESGHAFSVQDVHKAHVIVLNTPAALKRRGAMARELRAQGGELRGERQATGEQERVPR